VVGRNLSTQKAKIASSFVDRKQNRGGVRPFFRKRPGWDFLPEPSDGLQRFATVTRVHAQSRKDSARLEKLQSVLDVSNVCPHVKRRVHGYSVKQPQL
jgi:hypothetical protein